MNHVDTTETTIIEMCAGYGGIGLGLKRVVPNLRTIAYSEIEAPCIELLLKRMEEGLIDAAPVWPDLKSFPYQDFHGRVDILVAGYSCQPFSAAGKRLGEKDPRHLWPHIAAGIRLMRPRQCFFENVEGHVTLGLSTVISDLEEMGYKVSWGLYSAGEVGAPHRRKRVFIYARDGELADTGDCGHGGWNIQGRFHWDEVQGCKAGDWDGVWSEATGCGGVSTTELWPARPGHNQYWWEPPRTVANSDSRRLERAGQEGRNGGDAMCEGGEPPRTVGNTENQGRRGLDDEPSQSGSRETRGHSNRTSYQEEQVTETFASLGLLPHGYPSELGQAVTYESDTSRAHKVLLSLWCKIGEETIQRQARGSAHVLAEAVLQSGVQLSAFPQRVCFFVWCLQTGHQVTSFGLPELWLKGEAGGSPHGQEPLEQLRRELAYALCVLSYRLALEGGEAPAQTPHNVQSVRSSGAFSWVVSEAQHSLQEVWESQLDEETWTVGAYHEAAGIGFSRVDELRMLGNGVVPSVAAKAWVELVEQ